MSLSSIFELLMISEALLCRMIKIPEAPGKMPLFCLPQSTPYDEQSGSSGQNAAFCLPQSTVNLANRRFPIGISTEALLCLMMKIPEAPGNMPLSASKKNGRFAWALDTC